MYLLFPQGVTQQPSLGGLSKKKHTTWDLIGGPSSRMPWFQVSMLGL